MPSTSGGLYIFLGDDRAGKLARISAMRRTLQVHPLDEHRYDASTMDPDDLLASCRQQPAAGKVRFIIVDEAHRLTAPVVEAVQQQAETISANACVLLLVEQELSVRHPLAGSPAHMTLERFELRASAAPKPFALTEALGRRDAAGALDAAHTQLTQGREPLETLGLVAWQLGRWLTVRRLVDAGYAPAKIAEALGWQPWQVERLCREVGSRPLDGLQQLVNRCWQLDVDAKRGRAIPELALEQLIVETCV